MNRTKSTSCWVVAVAVAAMITAGVPAAAENDFILRAPAAEANEIAVRNGLEIIKVIEAPGALEGQGLYRVRAAEGVDPQTVIDTIDELEPEVAGIEEVARASLPELDQSTMAILDQSTMAILDTLMASNALTPPVGQAGPGLLGEANDRKIKKMNVEKNEYHDEKLVIHMQHDENNKRQDVQLRADFAPGCHVEFNRAVTPSAEAAGLEFDKRKVKWEITNNSDTPLTLSRIDVTWPSANLRLKKVKLQVEVKQYFEPTSVSVDFTNVKTAEERQIEPGRTERLELEFETDAVAMESAYSIVVAFAEGLSVASEPCTIVADNDPDYDKNKLEWLLINTGHGDVFLESVTIGWPEENGLILKIEFKGKPVHKVETEFGKIFDSQGTHDRFVWTGYVDQPAAAVLRVTEAQKANKGYATVAVIDTGVDPGHWLLSQSLVPGYDFIRDEPGSASELDALLDQSTMAILDSTSPMPLEEEEPVQLDQSTMAILDAEQAAALSATGLPPAFGHGTMVAGVIHRVAPYASIMPLRVFDANGYADLLDIVEAIYFAVDNGANVINMSFNVETFSPELMRAINYAARNGVACVASAGNNGKEKIVYPAAFGSTLGVAASNLIDEVTLFSNLGNDLVTVAAPGEMVVTTFPGGGWAVASGTSFAAPWVSGASAIFADKNGREHQPGRADFFLASEALSHAVPVQGRGAGRAGHGRADLKEAVDKLKGGVAVSTTGVSEYPHTILVEFTQGCSVAYPPADAGAGCAAESGIQLEVDGNKVLFDITNAGFETIAVSSIELSWPAVQEGLKKIKLDGDEIYNQLSPPTSVFVNSGWRDPDKPEKLEIDPGDTVELKLEFEKDAA